MKQFIEKQYERPSMKTSEFANEQGFAASGTPSFGGSLTKMTSTNGSW